MSDKFLTKNSKRRNKSKDFLLSFNIYNLSNDPSLKDIISKPIIKINENNNKFLKSSPEKINEGTNTIRSILKNVKTKNKNRHNYYNVKKKNAFPNLDDVKYVDEYNSSTIHSNGKFQFSRDNQENLTKFDKKLFIKEKVKKFILNQNNLNNNKEKQMQDKGIMINNIENNKKGVKDSWKGLNISSHYLGNAFNNQFGITSNRFYLSKDFILTHSREDTKYKNDYTTNSLLMHNNKKDLSLKFITLNMPNNSNFFNGMSSSNIFSKMKNIINNEKLYQKLIYQMTRVFKNRINKYSLMKSYQNHNQHTYNENYLYRRNIDVNQQKLFNDNQYKMENIKRHNHFVERNNLFTNINREKNKTFNKRDKYTQIKIRNVNKSNFGTKKITMSSDDMDMKIYKKKK